MKKSEAQQSAGEKLETPVRLTPEQLETVAAGFLSRLPNVTGPIVIGPPTTTWGLIYQPPKNVISAAFGVAKAPD